ncbi:MAG: DUF87 domain-containing protein [Anaerolineales bacterium]
MDYEGKFYIGRVYDTKSKKAKPKPVLYDPDDLTTHGVVVGMTGSGKTGLCIDILEEAALNGIPALLVDPKGDIGNLLLHFPELKPEDFQPWVDPEEARREGKTVEELSANISSLWRKGLKEWDIEPDRIERVRTAVDYAVYSPGSDAGIPVSVLASLKAPTISWDENRESLRERISSTVTALLGLVGIEADPVQSREHVLLSNIFEHLWKAGQDLDLTSLIQLIQRPPFDRLGALEMEQVFDEDDRFKLAMALNNLLASPTFQAWTEGVPLDIEALLWSPDGKPRQSVFYLAHLPDSERMFFVTLLLSSLETWMRTQSGSPSLRALLYFDEVFGYLPPVAKPPSKAPMLRLLKTARAFGIGLLLATQNPVDLDYKGLSNAGTWFVGRLQTERDKARLLDGLESATAGQGGFKRSQADNLISALGKRAFLLHNVHEKAPQVFQTRWAMAYLKGPITRIQLKELNDLVGAEVAEAAASVPAEEAAIPAAATPVAAARRAKVLSTVRPAVPSGIDELFLPNNRTLAQALKASGMQSAGVGEAQIHYRPALLAQAVVRYLDRKINLDHEQMVTALVVEPDERGIVRWEEDLAEPVDSGSLDRDPAPNASFADLEAPLSSAADVKRMRKDFLDYAYYSAELNLPSNPTLKLVASPGTSAEEFGAQCERAAKGAHAAEADKLKAKYEKKIKTIENKLAREERELAEDQAELSGRKMEELATHAENVLGLFTGSRSRRRVSSSLTKRRLTSKAKADVEESQEAIEAFKLELDQLEDQLRDELDVLDDRWDAAAQQVEQTVVKPYKKDILADLFGVAWFPYWRFQVGEKAIELAAYASQGT